MDVSAEIDYSGKYRLLQLTPALEKSLREGSLKFKSGGSGDRVFLCTDTTTHFVRKLKQSNSLLLTKPTTDSLKVFSSAFDLLETIEVKGEVDWSTFPEYTGHKKHTPAVDQPSQEWLCSPHEFLKESRNKPAVELDSVVYRISPNVVHDVIVDIVSAMVEMGDSDLKTPLESLILENGEPAEVVNAVFAKFYNDEIKCVDKTSLSTWIGLYVLKSFKSGVNKSQLLKEWSLELPVKIPTEISLLHGFIVEPMPLWVQYIDPGSLSSDPRGRFDDLFAIKPEWTLEEMGPFLVQLVPATQKLDNWILKFARRRKQGSTTLITPMRRR